MPGNNNDPRWIGELAAGPVQVFEGRRARLFYVDDLKALVQAAEAQVQQDCQTKITKMAAKGYIQHLVGCKRKLFIGDCDCGLHNILAVQKKGQS